MRYLFFDTETTGLPRDYKAHYSMMGNWPRIVQLAWMMTDADGQMIAQSAEIIKPEGYRIPDGMIHGISHQKAMEEGVSMVDAMVSFKTAMYTCGGTLVAHNSAFDSPIVACEFFRLKDFDAAKALYKMPAICTMDSTVEFCKLPGKYGYKWPKLMELHQKLFGEGFEGAHDALADVKATARCFFELKRLRVL